MSVWERAFKSSHCALRLCHSFLASFSQSSLRDCVAQQQQQRAVCALLFGVRSFWATLRTRKSAAKASVVSSWRVSGLGRFLSQKPPWDDAPRPIPGCPSGTSTVGRNSPSASSAPRGPAVAHRSTLLVFAQNDCYLGIPPGSRGWDRLQRVLRYCSAALTSFGRGCSYGRERVRGFLGPPRSASMAVGTNRSEHPLSLLEPNMLEVEGAFYSKPTLLKMGTLFYFC